MDSISNLSYDILIYIAEYLTSKELCRLSQCNQFLYQLQWVDVLWKRYCFKDYQIHYNHPDQTYRQLYLQCKKANTSNKRSPCYLLQHACLPSSDAVQRQEWQSNLVLDKCQRCFVTGLENLFICLSSNCYELVCDRHARNHSRLDHRDNNNHHSLFYKPNMSELFCQICVDWVGGVDTDPAEQYHAILITEAWSNYLNNQSMKDLVAKTKPARQWERHLRWKDTPQFIMNNPNGFCFISSNWMAEWEMFVEGWKTEPPLHTPIDQTTLLSSVIHLNSVGANPFYLSSTDNVMIISNDTWNYISKVYRVKGNRITEDDLKPDTLYQSISKRIEFWKKRATDVTLHNSKKV